MALEQDIAALVASSDNLTQAVEGQVLQIDQKINQMISNTDAAINRLNTGHLDSLILIANKAGVDLDTVAQPYYRFLAKYTGESTGGTTKFMDLLSFSPSYGGHYIHVNLSSYMRGSITGASGFISIRAANDANITNKNELLISSAGGQDMTSYFQVVDESGTVIIPNPNGGYSLSEGSKIKIQVKVTHYWQLSAIVDVLSMA